MRVAVVGGGLAGLGASLFLARRGHHVTILERDGPPPPSAGEAQGWRRRGTPQAGQSHAFVARCRRLLAAEAPDVLDLLAAAGAGELAVGPPPTIEGPADPDPELVVLACRRPVFEWALRTAVERQPGVAVRTGSAAAGLVVASPLGGVPVVAGVGCADGSVVPADVVVDCGGRRSPVGAWLADLGARLPDGEVVPCGIAYWSQFFERRPGAGRPPLNRGYVGGGSFDRYSCLVFPGDGDTFSVTFGVLPEDRALRGLSDERAFAAAARRVPVVAEWMDPGDCRPISDPAGMYGLENRWRPLVTGGRPAALGVVAVGDAACITNPAHTRGSTLALSSALAAARAVDEHADPEALALAVDRDQRADLEPWFHDSVEQDATRLARWRPGSEPPVPAAGRVTNAEAAAAAQRDPVVWRSFTRAQQLLEPAAVLGHADLVERTRAVLRSGWRPPALDAPPYDELAAAVAGEPVG
ncbi:MAG TPA: FAD-dependent oxidoreductase [Solirubrobacterales bacterium]|nr:FAD-dependent oxidoreductase [Solirubrobacterales bacterium]